MKKGIFTFLVLALSSSASAFFLGEGQARSTHCYLLKTGTNLQIADKPCKLQPGTSVHPAGEYFVLTFGQQKHNIGAYYLGGQDDAVLLNGKPIIEVEFYDRNTFAPINPALSRGVPYVRCADNGVNKVCWITDKF